MTRRARLLRWAIRASGSLRLWAWWLAGKLADAGCSRIDVFRGRSGVDHVIGVSCHLGPNVFAMEMVYRPDFPDELARAQDWLERGVQTFVSEIPFLAPDGTAPDIDPRFADRLQARRRRALM